MTAAIPIRSTPQRWLLAFLAAGLAWRLGRYLLRFPLWGDEAFIACDVLDHGDADLLTTPPEYFQVAPLLFRWLERFALEQLGPNELALRLFPLLAGCGALLLFARIAWTTLSAWPAALATGIFAAAYPLARHANEVKPYAGDALCATLILWAALRWTKRPTDWTRPVFLTLVAAASLWLSFPAVLVAAGIGVGLVFALPRRQFPTLAFYMIAVSASLVFYYDLYARAQIVRSAGSWLENYWSAGFPPHNALGAALWLIKAHASEMFAYPLGGKDFGSTASGALFFVGLCALVRTKQTSLATMLLLPFLAGIAAAALHRYPYGTASRLAQHLAPFICLLIGAGVGHLREMIRTDRTRNVALVMASVVLLAIPVVGFTRDLLKPYKFEEDAFVRAWINIRRRDIPAGATVGILNPREAAEDPHEPPQFLPTARFYLRAAGYRVSWLAEAPHPLTPGWLVACHDTNQPPQSADVEALLKPAGLQIRNIISCSYLPVARKFLDFYETEQRPTPEATRSGQ